MRCGGSAAFAPPLTNSPSVRPSVSTAPLTRPHSKVGRPEIIIEIKTFALRLEWDNAPRAAQNNQPARLFKALLTLPEPFSARAGACVGCLSGSPAAHEE